MAMTRGAGDAEPAGNGHPEAGPLRAAACLFHAVSDPSRLAILECLRTGEQRVVDLTRHLGLAQSTVSKHLACLRDCGLVESRPRGRASVFRLRDPDVLTELLGAAARVLERTGDAAPWSPAPSSSAASSPAGTALVAASGGAR